MKVGHEVGFDGVDLFEAGAVAVVAELSRDLADGIL